MAFQRIRFDDLDHILGPSAFAERDGSAANSIAAAVVSGRRSIVSPFSRVGSGGFDLFATLRWAALLMRDRSDILARLVDLYGGSNSDEGIRIYSPSIVDFDLWFVENPQSNFSSLDDQIDVMSLLAKLDSNAVILNFAPFCPLRAAMERAQGNRDPLARLMYGSDFSMIGREAGHEDYLVDVRRAVSGFGGGDLVDRIMSLNAIEYLGLADPESPTRRRLSRFFPEGHLYHQYFD